MTERPFTSGPDGPGPFDEPGAGHPDVIPADEPTLAEPEGTTWLADRPDRSGESITETSSSSTYPGYVTADSDPVATSGSSSQADSKVDTAKGEAKQVADTALDSGKEVAQTAKDQAQNVATEAKQQAVSLLDTVRTEVGQQAGTQQGRIAEALHSLSTELSGMASASQESGPLTDLAQQASRKGGEVADWLADREPADVLEAVRGYARRRPGTFLVLCGLAGVVAGRLTRSVVATKTNLDSGNGSDSTADRSITASSYSTEPSANYDTRPVTEPVGMSTGLYGGTVESTEPPTDTSYLSDPPLPGGGYVGTTGGLDDPNGGPAR